MTTTNPNPLGSIVVGVDGSPSSDQALLWAADEARRQNRGLLVVHTEHSYGTYEQAWLASAGISPRVVTDQIHRDALDLLDCSRRDAVEHCPGLSVETSLRIEDARNVLLDLSAHAAMVVVGSRGHGRLVGTLLGSVSGLLARKSHCPVTVVRPMSGEHDHRGVLVSGDGSKDSLDTIELAFREAASRDLPLTVVNCLWDPLASRVRWTHLHAEDPGYDEARLTIAEALVGMSEKFPDVDVHFLVTKGDVGDCLVDLSRMHDLLVLGRHAHSFGERLAWSGLTTDIVEHAASPGVVVP
jgi:nucleotide-binding universal stress UspA family protein